MGTDFPTTELNGSTIVPASESDMLSVKYYEKKRLELAA